MLRVQSSEGTKRVTISADDHIRTLYEKVLFGYYYNYFKSILYNAFIYVLLNFFKVHETFSLNGFSFSLSRSRTVKDELPSSHSTTILSSGIKHGDILYLIPHEGAQIWPAADQLNPLPSSTPGTSTPSTSQSTPSGLY